MDEVNQYLAGLDLIAKGCVRSNSSGTELFERMVKESAPEATQLIQNRQRFLSEADREKFRGFWSTGVFSSLDGDERLSAFVVCNELEQTIEDHQIDLRFESYQPTHPVFTAFPDLYQEIQSGELLPASVAKHLREDGVIQWKHRFLRLDPYLKSAIVGWTRSNFPDSPLFVRIDPHFVQQVNPPRPVNEEILIPANPKWWDTLSIHSRCDAGSTYVLQEPTNPADDQNKYWDYHSPRRRVRRLEVHARRKEQYLSMMVEEICDFRDTEGFVLGRCVHWDTGAPAGTPVSSAVAKHLDLAINIYRGDSGDTRMRQNLARGRVVDATIRIHLLRIENLSSNALFGYAQLFFRSKSLLGDWVNDQFAGRLPTALRG